MSARRSNRRPNEGDALVLSLLADEARALSVYQIRDVAAARGERIAPMQVYRILQRLMADGTVRRIEALSAYVRIDGEADAIAICRRCRRCLPLPLGHPDPGSPTDGMGDDFAVERLIVEAIGLCSDCRS